MEEIDTLLTTRQLQDLLQVDRITIYRMLNDGRLQGFKVGGQWRFPRQLIEKWLDEQRSSLEVPAFPKGAGALKPSTEALPLSCMRAIQDVFAEALGIGCVTTAVDGTPMTPVANSCEFCNLILGNQAGRQRCITSWRAASEQPRPVSGQIQNAVARLVTCHAGLSYVWGKIIVREEFVAAIHAGQFLHGPPDGDGWAERLANLSATTGVQVPRLLEALEDVRVLDPERQRQVPRLLQRVAATFSEIGEERLSLLGRLQRIAEITQL